MTRNWHVQFSSIQFLQSTSSLHGLSSDACLGILMMQSSCHTVRNGMVFLPCAVSCGSSGRRPWRSISHNKGIWMAFLLCDLSDGHLDILSAWNVQGRQCSSMAFHLCGRADGSPGLLDNVLKDHRQCRLGVFSFHVSFQASFVQVYGRMLWWVTILNLQCWYPQAPWTARK